MRTRRTSAALFAVGSALGTMSVGCGGGSTQVDPTPPHAVQPAGNPGDDVATPPGSAHEEPPARPGSDEISEPEGSDAPESSDPSEDSEVSAESPPPDDEGNEAGASDTETAETPCRSPFRDVSGAVDSEPIAREGGYLLVPPVREAGHSAALIVVPGAQVHAEAYVALAQATQRRSPFRLWVAIVEFPGGMTNPVQLGTRLDRIMDDRTQWGDGDIAVDDVMLAGHSLGGIFARREARARGLGGLILLGSYLSHGWFSGAAEDDDRLAVLTLGAELDGLTRCTRIALAYAEHEAWVAAHGTQHAVALRPVVLMAGASHMQFADGGPLEGDLTPEISLETAHDAIAEAVAAFLGAHIDLASDGDVTTAKALDYLGCLVRESSPYLAPFVRALEGEQALCRWAQERILERVPGVGAALTVSAVMHQSELDFIASQPSLETSPEPGRDGALRVHGWGVDEPNPMDVATVPVSAKEVACKMLSGAAIAAALGQTTSGEEPTCSEVNAATFAWALDHVTPAARQRYEALGWHVEFAADREYLTQAAWTSSTLIRQEDANTGILRVSSPRFVGPPNAGGEPSAGVHDCKYASAARAMEWILVDSHKSKF